MRHLVYSCVCVFQRAAHDASQQMLQFFGDNPQTHSHFSDLFRLAVLWKYGNIVMIQTNASKEKKMRGNE